MVKENTSVLIVEDEEAHAEAICRAFRKDGAKASIRVAGTVMEYRLMVAHDPPDIAIMDVNLPDGNAFDVLATPQDLRPYPILIITSHGNENTAVEALKAGALDYVVKSQDAFASMPRIVTRALREWALLQEKKRMVEALRVSEEKHRRLSQEYHALLDSLPDGIVQIGPDLRVIWANRSMTVLVKADESQMKGNCCYHVFWDLAEQCDSCPVMRCFRTGELEFGNFTARDGRLLELRAVPIFHKSGMVESVIEVMRDITEQKRLGDQLRQAQKLESIGTLAGGIAHDFNNILTAIVGYGHIALMNMAPDDKQRVNIENMLAGTDRAAKLTQDLLLYSRKQICEKRPVDLNEVIRRVEKFLVRIIGEDINFNISLPVEPIIVNADTHQLEQVLMNLATNARDAMPKGGELIIGAEPVSIGDDFVANHGYGTPGRYALLTISDSGEGMEEETRLNIFEPFFTTKDVGKGTGLGLSVVYGIVKQHDGFINVYSEPGMGTSFKIYLPVISAQVYEEEKALYDEIPLLGTETILLVEDEDLVRDLVRIVLEKHGYTVIEAVDGKDAVKKFNENRESIDLLVSDFIMPKMNGLEAYEEMKKWRPGLKAIFASGYAPEFVRHNVLMESGMELIPKPILPNMLLKKIRNILNGNNN